MFTFCDIYILIDNQMVLNQQRDSMYLVRDNDYFLYPFE